MNRQAERKRLIELIGEAHKKSAGAIHEHIMATLKRKGSFNSKTDRDIRTIYEIEADHLLENTIIAPPCKLHTHIWVIPTEENSLEEITEMVVRGFSIGEPCNVANCFRIRGTSALYQPSFDMFGKTVFLSEAEAKYALKNRRSVSLVNGHIEE